jgi:hypothetical protein
MNSDLYTELRSRQRAEQQRLAGQLDDCIRQALLITEQLDASGICSGAPGLALEQCQQQLEQAGHWCTGVRLHVG